ncbi:MAG: UDP-glucose/GDP-mannose dehydrogenase family protein [Dehalococcoidia bacterium]|nr:MAG: UDP-glucose/GDP-mannose dehydrogenase family protein [Dehalococcoidia bacterium]
MSVVGIGYVGLCTAVGFASKGYKVIAADKNPEKVSSINQSIPPFYEHNLEESLQKAIKDGYLRCVLDSEQAIVNTDITFITVGTPSKPDGSINLKQINDSAIEIGEALSKKDAYPLVVVKSTVVPGTTENVVKPLLEKHSGKKCGSGFGLCMNPEFLREGSAVHDARHPDRIVIGEYDKKSGCTLEALYCELHYEESIPIVRTNLLTAELIKYANNAFLATKISFINTIANICEKIPGADITTVAKGIGLDQRINPQFLRAGLGYGGSYFPKDVKALIAFSNKRDYTPTILQAVEEVNENQAKNAVEKATKELRELQGKTIAILGLSFKPDTDDMREARSIPIINQFLKEGADFTAYDPVAVSNAESIFGDKIKYASSAIECLKNADCCIIVTEWKEFKKLKPETFTQNMRTPILIDGRRIINPEEFSNKLKFAAIGLGQ